MHIMQIKKNSAIQILAIANQGHLIQIHIIPQNHGTYISSIPPQFLRIHICLSYKKIRNMKWSTLNNFKKKAFKEQFQEKSGLHYHFFNFGHFPF
jgi:hypothetical protein